MAQPIFIESPRFPEDVSYGTSFGPSYSTNVNPTKSGAESRNAIWENSLAMGNVAFGIKTYAQLQEVSKLFHNARGKASGFRFKDFIDFKSCDVEFNITKDDQVLGLGDNTTVIFQLIKTYTSGAYSVSRDIRKPVIGTLQVAIDGVLKTETTDYTIDYTTGLITFLVAPLLDEIVSAGYEFDIPIRFDIDHLSTSLESFQAGSLTIPIKEIRT